MSVDISACDRLELLRLLWEHSKPASFFIQSGLKSPEYDETLAKQAIEQNYIDYFQGRAIKTDLSGDLADPYGYDREHGIGTFEKIVNLCKLT